VDDLQWLDEASARVLGSVARRLLAEPVALVFAARGPSDERQLAASRSCGCRGSTTAMRALLESVIPGPIDERVRDRIVAETRGNPLALLELPRGRSVAERAGGLVVPAPLGLSGSIDDGFQRRLDALPADTRRLLQLAAADQLGIQPEVVTPAVEADLPEIRTQVRFRHPLVRTAASRSASPGRDPADRPRPGGPRPVGLDRSPSRTLFLVGGVLTGVGASAIFRGSLGVALATSRADERAGTLATFFKPAMRPSRCRCSASASRFST